MNDSPIIIITLEIFPADAKGKRKLIASGAPQGEMPAVKSGLFSERHQLLDALWIELGTRKAQKVKVKQPKAEKKDGDKVAGATGDQLVGEPIAPVTESVADQLPLIANDPTAENKPGDEPADDLDEQDRAYSENAESIALAEGPTEVTNG